MYKHYNTPGTRKICLILDKIVNDNYHKLCSLFEDSMKKVAEEMFQAGIISCDVKEDPTFDSIIKSFLSAFNFMENLEDIQKHCQTFLSVFTKMGGPFVIAGEMIKKKMHDSDFDIS